MEHRSSHQQQQMTSGLTRYRSAPSSYFSSLLNSNYPASVAGGGGSCGYASDDFDQLLDARASNTDIKQVFDRFVANIGDGQQIQQNPMTNLKQENEAREQQMNSQFIMASVKQETQQSNDYSLASQMNYQTQALQQNDNSNDFTSAMDSIFRILGSVDSNRPNQQMKMDGGVGADCSNSNLTRYNSSPAGLFAQVNIESEYGAMKGIGNYGAKGMDESRLSGQSLVEGNKNDESYMTGFSIPSWEDSQISTDDFLQVPEDNETGPFSNANASDNPSSEGRARPPTLLSHLSLPQTTAELSAMEKLLQDSVPCKVRAKRGCATHPRSIAERVRRTRISERMRKLQELVPNMDKQTNTADMLDFAADYIKELETQVKVLSERRERCTCSK